MSAPDPADTVIEQAAKVIAAQDQERNVNKVTSVAIHELVAENAKLRDTIARVRALADHLAGTEWFRMTHGAAATRIYAALDGEGEQHE